MNPFCVRLSSQGHRDYTFSYFYNEGYSVDAQRILARSHADSPGAWCNCTGLHLPVSIHRLDLPGGARYHLARFPGTGHQHARPCPFYGEDAPAAASEGVAPEDETEIALNVPLSYRVGDKAPVESRHASAHPATPKPHRPTISLLSFAKRLFRRAGLHQCWDAKIVRYYQASHRLIDSIEGLLLHHRPAAETLFIPAGYDDANKASRQNDIDLEAMMGPWKEGFHLGLVIGQIRKEDEVADRFGVIHLEALQSPLFCSLDVMAYLRRADKSWPGDGILDAERFQRWLVATVQVSSKNKLWIQEAQILRTTVGYVPVDTPAQAREAHEIFLVKREAFERKPENATNKKSAFVPMGAFSPFK